MVLANRRVVCERRSAALPERVHNCTVPPMAVQASTTPSIDVVLPVPAPPEITESCRSKANWTEATCSPEGCGLCPVRQASRCRFTVSESVWIQLTSSCAIRLNLSLIKVSIQAQPGLLRRFADLKICPLATQRSMASWATSSLKRSLSATRFVKKSVVVAVLPSFSISAMALVAAPTSLSGALRASLRLIRRFSIVIPTRSTVAQLRARDST